MNVFIVGGGIAYHRMFHEQGFTIVDNWEHADLIQFCGGADVTPKLYGHYIHRTTGSNILQDEEEQQIYEDALECGIPMVGICRGGQFLNVMNGGTMIQDCDGHAIGGIHSLIDYESGEAVQVSSTHHQMMVPHSKGVVVATALGQSKRRESCEYRETKVEYGVHNDVEVVWYPDSSSLCFQPHPEFNGVVACREYYFRLINKYVGIDKGIG